MKKIIENYEVDTTTQNIKGHYELNLIVGNKYEIHCGIHQGIYEYVGKSIKNLDFPDFGGGQHLFKECISGKITFGYFGTNSPFEFTRIVKPYKD